MPGWIIKCLSVACLAGPSNGINVVMRVGVDGIRVELSRKRQTSSGEFYLKFTEQPQSVQHLDVETCIDFLVGAIQLISPRWMR